MLSIDWNRTPTKQSVLLAHSAPSPEVQKNLFLNWAGVHVWCEHVRTGGARSSVSVCFSVGKSMSKWLVKEMSTGDSGSNGELNWAIESLHVWFMVTIRVRPWGTVLMGGLSGTRPSKSPALSGTSTAGRYLPTGDPWPFLCNFLNCTDNKTFILYIVLWTKQESPVTLSHYYLSTGEKTAELHPSIYMSVPAHRNIREQQSRILKSMQNVTGDQRKHRASDTPHAIKR